MSADIYVISAGAAKGVVEALRREFEQATSCAIQAQFGAVGAMKERLLEGAACDVLVLTQSMLEDLARDGTVDAASIRPLGRVYTGIAIVKGASRPHIDHAQALADALSNASALYLPDPQRATAGIHFARVLAELGLTGRVSSRLRAFPNGATAMRAMADSGDVHAIGCTQVTEILYTPGVELVGRLPTAFELSTLYCAALCRRGRSEAAQRLLEMLTGEGSATLRRDGGFEPG